MKYRLQFFIFSTKHLNFNFYENFTNFLLTQQHSSIIAIRSRFFLLTTSTRGFFMFKIFFSLFILTTAMSTYCSDNSLNSQILKKYLSIAQTGTIETFNTTVVPELFKIPFKNTNTSTDPKLAVLGLFFNRPDITSTEKISVLHRVAQHNPDLGSILPLITMYDFAMLYEKTKKEILNALIIAQTLKSKIEHRNKQLETERNQNQINNLTKQLDFFKKALEQIPSIVAQNEKDLELLKPLVSKLPNHIREKHCQN